MSVKNLFMMICMVIVFPIIIICYNADAFFIIMSIILIFAAIGNLRSLTSVDDMEQEEVEYDEVDEELTDLGEVLGINTRRLGYGFIVAMDLMVITYFIYALLTIHPFVFRAIAVVLIADWVYDIITIIDNMINPGIQETGEDRGTWKDRLYELYLWLHNIATIGFIIIVFGQKYVM